VNRRRWALAAGAAGLVSAFWLLPLALRQVPFFRVRQVEVVGARFLAPESVLVALELRPRRHLFDDNDEVAKRAAALPGVVEARVERRLPGTLRVALVQREPVAFAPGANGLIALDAEGAPLPYDPAATGLGLPLVPRPDSLVVQALWVVRATDSSLFGQVQAAHRAVGGAVVLDLAGQQIVLAGVPTAREIRAVGAVRRHLAETGRRAAQLDARFAGRIIARRSRA